MADMDRRQFLKRAGAAIAAGMVLDPDRLLWVPGAKTYFVPDPAIVTAETIAEALSMGLCAKVPNGHGDGGWMELELHLRAGPNLDARLNAEIAAITRMGGYVTGRRTYKTVTV